mgnify:CR=1 FL=1
MAETVAITRGGEGETRSSAYPGPTLSCSGDAYHGMHQEVEDELLVLEVSHRYTMEATRG